MFRDLSAFLSSVIARVIIPDRRAPRQFQTALGIPYILVGQSEGEDLYRVVLIPDRRVPRQFQTALGIPYILVGQSEGEDLYRVVLIRDRRDSDGGEIFIVL